METGLVWKTSAFANPDIRDLTAAKVSYALSNSPSFSNQIKLGCIKNEIAKNKFATNIAVLVFTSLIDLNP